MWEWGGVQFEQQKGHIISQVTYSLSQEISITQLELTLLVIFRFVITHYNDVEPYFAMDPLLRAVFIVLTPEDEFPLLYQRMPSFLTVSRLTHMMKKEIIDKKMV